MYGYDANGNLTSVKNGSDERYYGYNGFGEMTLAAVGDKIANYEYDYAGLRIGKTVDGKHTEFINNGDSVIAELSEGQLTNYYRGISLIVFEQNDEYYYYKLNAHGDTIGILNGLGEQIKSYTYDAFGNEQTPDKFDTNPFRYCGEYFDNETGLIYLRARYYDSNTQRFISEDPIRDCFNWYTYCGNNPCTRIDPKGESWEDTLYGFIEAVDDNNMGGFVVWAAKKLTGDKGKNIDSQYDYYLGRVIGDALSILSGAKDIAGGITTIIKSIIAGGTVSIGSGGTLIVGGMEIAVAGAAAGTAEITYGSAVIVASAGNFKSDFEKLKKSGNNSHRILNTTKIKGYKVSMDIERGGSGKNNVHLEVDGEKYYLDFEDGEFYDSSRKKLPKSLRKDQTIKKATSKAYELIENGW